MSILVAAASPEGIALAADSRTTQKSGDHHRVCSDSALKLFQLPRGAAVGTYGMATIDGVTIRGLMEEFVTTLSEAELAETAEALGCFFRERLDKVTPSQRGDYRLPQGWPLGFVIAGYDEDGPGRVLDVRVRPTDHRVQEADISSQNPGVTARGQTGATERLLNGVDWPAVGRRGIAIPADAQEQLRLLRYDLILPQTVSDAAELAYFLIRTTIDMQRFADGTYLEPREIPGCGGPIRVAVVTRSSVELDWDIANISGAKQAVRPPTSPR